MDVLELEQSGIAIRNRTEAIIEPVFYWQLVSNDALLGMRYQAFTYKDKIIRNKNELEKICRQLNLHCLMEDMKKNVRL